MADLKHLNHDNQWHLESGDYLGDISALCFLHLPSPLSHFSSFPFLLAGSGSQLLLYNIEKGRFVQYFRVFDGIRVHGINCNLIGGGGSECRRSSFVYDLAVYGERRVKLFNLCVCDGGRDQELCFELKLINSLPKFSNWVLDVCFLKWGNGVPLDERSQYLAIGCGDNSIYLWDINKSKVVLEVHSPERCLLYSMRLWGECLEDLQIASGTIYNEIIVWRVVPLDSSSICPIEESNMHTGKFNYFEPESLPYEAFHMCRLVGHEGSIFRIAWSPCGSRLISTSDDRSARIWKIHSEVKVSDDAGKVVLLFGHNARVWDCVFSDKFIVTAGEDCSCRVWGLDGIQLKAFKEHIGRGIWRCLYDQKTSLLVTGGFDSAIKVHHLHASLAESLAKAAKTKEKEGVQLLSIRIPNLPEGNGLMDSKSEYVRCLRFSCEDIIYIATNHGYLYHAKLCNDNGVEWTQIVRVHDGVQIISMDLLSQNSSRVSLCNEDWIAIGDGKGKTTIVRVIKTTCSPEVVTTFTWSAEMDRQLLGVFWCKSLGHRFIFTANPRGALKLWKLNNSSQCSSFNEKSLSVSLIAEFASSFGFRVMCMDAAFEEELLICGDLRGNLVLFPLWKDILLNESILPKVKISPISHFKGAHGISTISSISLAWPSSDHIDIRSTGADGCICYLEYARDLRTVKFVGMKKVKELSLIQLVFPDNNSINDFASSIYAAGFASGDFIIWNLETETKVVQVSCGGWRRPHSFYLGDVPEMRNCFAYVKDEIVHVCREWTMDTEDKMIPQNLHMQFHGRELHSLCFVYEDSKARSDGKASWIATGCEDGTVRLTKYVSCGKTWFSSKLLGEHVGGSAVRSICYVSRIHTAASDSTFVVDGADMKKDGYFSQTCSTENEDEPCLLVSVGAKRVLTSWLLKKKAPSRKDEYEINNGSLASSAVSDSISFRWLSTDMPVKYSMPPKKLEKIKRMVASCKNPSNRSSDGVKLPESGELQSKTYHEDKSEDDWRYLAVTAFLVRYAGSRLTVCFIVVACSDATLALRALVLPHCLWFDVALLAPLSSPVLSLQHIVVPFSPLSDGEAKMGNLYIVISGATDGSISLWDLTGSVEAFMRQLSSIHLEKLVGGQTRPRTGRGSQGGRWWRSLGRDISKRRLGLDSVSTKCKVEEKGITMESVSDFYPSVADYTHDITNEVTKSASPKIDEKADDSLFEICEVCPLHVLHNIHQSGVNCLHVSDVKHGQNSGNAFLYQIVSGGDDQAIASCKFEVLIQSLSTHMKVLAPDLKNSAFKSEEVIGLFNDNKYQNCSPLIKFIKHDKIVSAHSSAVKGVWTDGTWVFSTGLDQRVRCWNLEEHGTLIEHAHLMINVPEPEALNVKALCRNHYQIAVAGRGMQMIEFRSI